MTDYGTLFVPCRVWTLNEEARRHWRWRAQVRRETRQAACVLARQALRAGTLRKPDGLCHVVVRPMLPRATIDCGNAISTSKGVVDGIVDAGVLPGDDPRYVGALTFLTGTRCAKADEGLRITLCSMTPDEP